MAAVDMIIRGGTVVDGTGTPAFVGDVAIKDGKILMVGPSLAMPCKEDFDATGKIVAPGWIGEWLSLNDINRCHKVLRNIFLGLFVCRSTHPLRRAVVLGPLPISGGQCRRHNLHHGQLRDRFCAVSSRPP